MMSMTETIQDTLSAAVVYRYRMDEIVVKMDTLQTANNILVWAIVFTVVLAVVAVAVIVVSSRKRLQKERLANMLLSKQAGAMPAFIEKVNAISNKSIKLSGSIYDEFQEAIDKVKREHKSGIMELMNDDEFSRRYPYLKKMSMLSVQEKYVLLLTENGCSNSQIALLLGASINTVRTVRNRVRNKLKQTGDADYYMKNLKIFKNTQQ